MPIIETISGAMSNQLVGGGFVLMLTGAVMALLRQVPAKIGNAIRRQFVVSLDIQDKDTAFWWVSQWLDRHPYLKKARSISVHVRHSDEPHAVFTPAPGGHYFWFKGRPIWLTRMREKTQAGTQTETLTLRTMGRNTAILKEIVDEAKAIAERPDNTIKVFASQRDYWQSVSSFAPRALSTVMLPDDIGERVRADIEEYRASKEWYEMRGIPWRRGYLFHGPPGTGKSSLIAALAGVLGFDLYVMNLASTGLDDDDLVRLLLNIPKGGALLLEDVDAVLDGRDVKGGEGQNPSVVTFSGLLNALDGVASKPGLMVFMTTNHIEKLDPALIRPGRVDMQIEFPAATPELVGQFFQHFYGKAADEKLVAEFIEAARPHSLSMAEVQQVLLTNKTDPEEALRAIRQRKVS